MRVKNGLFIEKRCTSPKDRDFFLELSHNSFIHPSQFWIPSMAIKLAQDWL